MKVLVIGGAGFIGAHLTRELLSRNVEVVVLDNFSTGIRTNLPTEVEIIALDCRADAVSKVISVGKFDAAVHLAAQTVVSDSIKNPRLDADVNVMGTINLLEAVRRSQSIERIIFASSAAVYGNSKELPIQEDSQLEPRSFYALTKVTAEEYLKLYHAIFGVNYVTLRFSNAYGEFQRTSGVISIFARKFLKGEPLVIYGNGNQTRDFIHARDVAGGIYRALVTDNVNDTYNISTCTEVSLNALITTMSRAVCKEVVLEYLPAQIGDVGKSVLSNERARKKLDWSPKIGLEEGLRRTLEYFGGL